MQIISNTTRRPSILSRIVARLTAVNTFYTLYVPGIGNLDSFDSISEAQAALRRLPFPVQQRAEIYDGDGVCVCR